MKHSQVKGGVSAPLQYGNCRSAISGGSHWNWGFNFTGGYVIESIPQAGRHSNTQTNKQLNRDDWGHTKLLSRGD